jgi:CRP/FNR family transcriptional regulator, cyclic AMP receptor protein
MDDDSLAAHLARMPLFAGLSDAELEIAAGTVLERRVKAGKTVIKAGNWGHEFVLVLEGELEVRREGKVVATLGPGDYVGEIAVLTDARRNATVVATTPAVIGAIDTGIFRSLLRDIPVVAERVAVTAGERAAPPEE